MNVRHLAFWTTAIKYLHLVEITTAETIKHGNQWTVITHNKISMEELSERTKWSDFNISVPILFNFFHGIELLLKGFIITKGDVQPIHKITKLFDRYSELFPDTTIISLLSPYISQINSSSVLGEFLSENNISIDDYYQALKYPTSTKGVSYSHLPLKYRTETGLSFFMELNKCIQLLRREAVALGRSLDPDC